MEHFVDTDMYVYRCTACRGETALFVELVPVPSLDEPAPELERGASPVPALERVDAAGLPIFLRILQKGWVMGIIGTP